MNTASRVERTSISLTSGLYAASLRYAETRHKSFSSIVADALSDYLAANDALPLSENQEKLILLNGLADACSAEELRFILEERRAKSVSAIA